MKLFLESLLMALGSAIALRLLKVLDYVLKLAKKRRERKKPVVQPQRPPVQFRRRIIRNRFVNSWRDW